MDGTGEARGPGGGTAFTTLGSIIARRWPVMLLAVVVCGGLWMALELTRSERYESTSRVLIRSEDLGASLVEVPSLGGGDPERAFATEKELASLPEIRERAEAAIAQTNGTDDTAEQRLASAVNTDGSSDVLELSVVAGRADYAQALATALAEEYVRYREELQTSEYREARQEIVTRARELARDGGSGTPAYQDLIARAQQLSTLIIVGGGRARVIAPGDEPRQVAPRPTRAAAMGLGFGLLAGVILALLLERLDTRVRRREEIEAIMGAPVIGWLPDPKKLGKTGSQVTLVSPDGHESEAFRQLRTNLAYSMGARGATGVLVTSAEPGEGKSFTAGNLAVAAAMAGRRVVLVDLDLRRPSLHRSFGVERGPGLSDVVAGLAPLTDALRAVDLPTTGLEGGGSLVLLPAGGSVPNPGEYVLSPRLWELISNLERGADLLVVDAPPALPVSDAAALGGVIGASLIVVRSDRADRTRLASLRDVLTQGGPQPLGIALTAAWRKRGRDYGYYESDTPVAPPGGGGASADTATPGASR